MQKIKQIFSLNRLFFEAVLVFLAGFLFFILLHSKAAGFLYLNTYHTAFLDLFFIYYTNLGDGLFSVAIVILLLIFRRSRMAWQILAAFLISGLIVQVLKNFIYSPRPKDFFKFREQIHIIEGVTLNGNASFPSGHSASIFALATLLALFSDNKKIGLVYLLAAIGVGYSRIYLAQHFPKDVIGGATIGVLTAVLVFFLFDKYPFRLKSRKSLGTEKHHEQRA
jgi:membrane-associated phospholipid phosphatase